MSKFSQQYLIFYGLMSIIAFGSLHLAIGIFWGTQKETTDTNIALQQKINKIYKDRPKHCFSGAGTARISEQRELSIMLRNNNSQMSRNIKVDLGDASVETPTKSEVPSVDDFTDEVRSPYEFDRNTLWKMSRCYASEAEQTEFLSLIDRWEKSKLPFNYLKGVIFGILGITVSVILIGAACDTGEQKRRRKW